MHDASLVSESGSVKPLPQYKEHKCIPKPGQCDNGPVALIFPESSPQPSTRAEQESAPTDYRAWPGCTDRQGHRTKHIRCHDDTLLRLKRQFWASRGRWRICSRGTECRFLVLHRVLPTRTIVNVLRLARALQTDCPVHCFDLIWIDGALG